MKLSKKTACQLESPGCFRDPSEPLVTGRVPGARHSSIAAHRCRPSARHTLLRDHHDPIAPGLSVVVAVDEAAEAVQEAAFDVSCTGLDRANGPLGVSRTSLAAGMYFADLSLMVPAFLAVNEFSLPGVFKM